jgi:polysaccharide export outer membrane protein
MKRLLLILIILSFAALNVNSWAEIHETSQQALTTVNIGDVISIWVLDNPHFNTTATVSVDGTITVPFLGAVYIKGKSSPEIEKYLVDKLKEGFIKYPVVSVSLNKGETRKIFTYGEIAGTGVVQFNENLTVLRALSVAGGITEKGLYGRIKVKRRNEDGDGYREIEIDLEGSGEGVMTGEMLLQPDDVLIVERNRVFYIDGEVMKPGEHVFKSNMTVSRALSVAGGVTGKGLYGRIKIKRRNEDGDGYREIEIDLEGSGEGVMTGEILLQPDDVLIVERNRVFYIYGEVNKVGEFELKKDLTAFTAITIAGGFTKWGSPDRVKIIRHVTGVNDEVKVLKVDIGAVVKGNISADIKLEPGDIIIVSSGLL